MLKDVRQRILSSVERFIGVNKLGASPSDPQSLVSAATADPGYSESKEWMTLIKCVQEQLTHDGEYSVDTDGRYVLVCTCNLMVYHTCTRHKYRLIPELSSSRSVILLLDDNNSLRSMRYQYYQLARKCKSVHVR